MHNSFASISALLDRVIGEEVHAQPKSKNSLYLIASNTEPIHFYDISKIKLIFPQDDLEAYLNSNPQINYGSTICLENVEIIPEYGKENDIIACEVQSKSIIIQAGTPQEKKLKSVKIRLQVETDSGEIPLLASTRRFIRRMKKQEIARKELKKQTKVDILAFINNKTSVPASQKSHDGLFSDEIGLLDTESIRILQKLTHFVNKDELFQVLASKPLQSKSSKKAVRLMVVPNEKQTKKTDNLVYKKKHYMREEVEELARHYENMDLEGK